MLFEVLYIYFLLLAASVVKLVELKTSHSVRMCILVVLLERFLVSFRLGRACCL